MAGCGGASRHVGAAINTPAGFPLLPFPSLPSLPLSFPSPSPHLSLSFSLISMSSPLGSLFFSPFPLLSFSSSSSLSSSAICSSLSFFCDFLDFFPYFPSVPLTSSYPFLLFKLLLLSHPFVISSLLSLIFYASFSLPSFPFFLSPSSSPSSFSIILLSASLFFPSVFTHSFTSTPPIPFFLPLLPISRSLLFPCHFPSSFLHFTHLSFTSSHLLSSPSFSSRVSFSLINASSLLFFFSHFPFLPFTFSPLFSFFHFILLSLPFPSFLFVCSHFPLTT